MNIEKEDLETYDKRYVWHPFTQMRDWVADKPLIIERGEGSHLVDVEGNRYIDGVSSLWVTVHGHRKREIDQALSDQLRKIAHSTLLGLSNVPSILLAKKLVEISPKNLAKVFYSDNGSTGVEVALKMAFQHWQQTPGGKNKTQFISFLNGYHGDTVGSVSVGGIDLFHAMYKPLLFHSHKANYPDCYRCYLKLSYPGCDLACLESVRALMAAHSGEVAALVIEPGIQAAGGMITAPRGYLAEIRRLCSEHGILLIVDEVATGFGRTGKMFACEHDGVEPDFMVLAKGITGGYLPLAATLTTNEVYSAFEDDYSEQKTFFHGHTYTGNPLACAAALANLEIFEKEKTLENLQTKIALLRQLLESVRRLEHIGDVRQLGFMVGIELVRDKQTREPYDWKERMGVRAAMACRKWGVIIRPLGNVVVLMPPLSISEEDLTTLVNVTACAVEKVTMDVTADERR